MTLVFYYNANLCLTDYKLYQSARQPHADKRGWLLKNSSGDVYIAPIDSGGGSKPPFPYTVNGVGGVPIYNFTVPEMRAAWVQECFDMVSPAGGFDGCMVDRWTRTPFKGNTLPPGFTKEDVGRRRFRDWKDAGK